MTVSFYKLQVSGDDFILVDLDKAAHAELSAKADALAELAAAILDRRRGVGGNAVVYVGGKTGSAAGALPVRVFQADGDEDYSGGDALLCAARWAFDSGRASLGKILLSLPIGERTLTALDSRSFAMEMEGPFAIRDETVGEMLGPEEGKEARIDLIVDGKAAAAYTLALDRLYTVAVAAQDGPGPKRVRTALAELLPDTVPVAVRPEGHDLVRFTAPEGVDRVSSAAAAVAAAVLAGRMDGEAAAEWRGRGGAVSFATFGSAVEGSAAKGKSLPGVGPAVLVDRGRFWVEWKERGRMRIVGLAEYSFEGNYDFFVGN